MEGRDGRRWERGRLLARVDCHARPASDRLTSPWPQGSAGVCGSRLLKTTGGRGDPRSSANRACSEMLVETWKLRELFARGRCVNERLLRQVQRWKKESSLLHSKACSAPFSEGCLPLVPSAPVVFGMVILRFSLDAHPCWEPEAGSEQKKGKL